MNDHLSVLRIILIPRVVESLSGSSGGDRRDESQREPPLCEKERQRAMVVPGGFKADHGRLREIAQELRKALVVVESVRDTKSSPSMSWSIDQDIVVSLRDIDAYPGGWLRVRKDRSHGWSSGVGVECTLQSYESAISHGFFVMYYGPEFVAEKIQDWIKTRPTDTFFIEPGSPWQNGHNESFNGVLRDGCLNRWAFLSVREARLIVESWRQEYNEERPHGALNQITPAAYAAGLEQENREAA